MTQAGSMSFYPISHKLQNISNSSFSSVKTTNTGGPRDCILSAEHFTLYTSDKDSSHDKCTIVNMLMTL